MLLLKFAVRLAKRQFYYVISCYQAIELGRASKVSSGNQAGRFGLGLAIGVFAFWYAAHDVSWRALQQSLAQASLLWVGLSIVGVIGVALLKTARWQLLYRVTQHNVSFDRLFWTLMVAQMINLLIPIRIGEVVRLGIMKRHGQSVELTLPTLLIEKAVDLLSAGLLLVSLTFVSANLGQFRQTALGLVIISAIIFSGAFLLWHQRTTLEILLLRTMQSRLPAVAKSWGERLQTFLGALGLLTSRRALVGVLGWSLAIWLVSLLTIIALLIAFELTVPLTAAILIMLAISFSNIFPSPPALVGLMPGIAVAILTPYQVPQASALGFGLVLNVVTVAPLVILGSWAILGEIEAVLAMIRR